MTKKIVIVGGGAIGLSVAYHLGKLGLNNVLLVERNQLTSGTSWHAAGIVGPLRASKNLTELAQYGIGLFRDLEQETGLATGYQQTGGMWLAQTPDRLIELKRIAAMGEMHQLHTKMIAPGEICEKMGLLHTEDLSGALWVEEDGQINPVDLCMAYAKGARQYGVEIREQSCVTDISYLNGEVTSVRLSDNSEIETEVLINCAGLWARELAAMVGVGLPLRAVEHIYMVSEVVESLASPCPILRDLDSAIYLKGDAGRLVLGAFEHNAKLWHSAGARRDPAYIEFPDDWEHIEPMIKAGIHRMPVLAESGMTRLMNGPESFTPDTRQIMGRAKGMGNFYIAAGFNSIGIMSSAGVGKVMADWVRDDHPPMDLWEVDTLRFSPTDNDDAFLDARIPESVHNQFAMHWPYKQFQTGRQQKQSVWHALMAEQGAVFGAPTGWERPLWFAQSQGESNLPYSYAEQAWWPCAEREAKSLMHSGAIFELTPFSKHIVSGDNATQVLQRLCSRSIDIGIDQLVYALMLNARGGIEMECTITRLAVDRYLIVSGAATRQKDNDWLRRGLPQTTTLQDVTEDYSVLGVMGPRSAELLSALGVNGLDINTFPFAHSREIRIHNQTVRASRISYVGEKGWELMIDNRSACAVLTAIIDKMAEFNIGFAGHWCLDSCRLEKDYVHWGHDIGPDDLPTSVGLEFAVDRTGTFAFVGQESISGAAAKNQNVQSVLLEVFADKPLLLHDEPVYLEHNLIGRTTSGGIGFRTGKALSMVTMQAHDAIYTSRYEIDIAGKRFPAIALKQAPYDPAGDKMRRD